MVKSLVIGGLGFIGSHIADLLLEKGHQVIIIDNESTGSIKNLNKNTIFKNADIANFESISPFFKDVDYVFHTAALPRIKPSFDDPVSFLKVNVQGTINCLLAAKANKASKFIFSSSSSVYGNNFALPTDENNGFDPLSPYALQKLESEMYCKLFSKVYNMSIVILRYFNVYGPRSFNEKDTFSAYSSPVGIFIKQKKSGMPLTITWDGEQKRDYINVNDVARANYAAAITKLENKFEIFNIGSGENHPVNEIANIVGGPKTFIPKREGEARITLAEISKAKKLLNWIPEVKFKEGIQEMMNLEGL